MVTKLVSLARRSWSAAPVVTGVLAFALVAALFFGTRLALFWYHHPPSAEREQPVAAWMTPRYVARSWRVPREVILGALQLQQPLEGGPVSLAEIAEQRGVPVDRVIADLERAITTYRDSVGVPEERTGQ